MCDLAVEVDVRSVCKKVTSPKYEGGMGLDVDILLNCGGIQRRLVSFRDRWYLVAPTQLADPCRTPAENFPDADWDDVRHYYYNVAYTVPLAHRSASYLRL